MSTETTHRLLFEDARSGKNIEEKIDLVVTSPPYPMIKMWDSVFTQLNPRIGSELEAGRGELAFDLMHRELEIVWRRIFSAVRHGGFICINIGDATRRLKDNFQLYPNHTKIVDFFRSLGAQALPMIFWNKPTNAPNKFMGSGMLPGGAYVTLEHEYILIFRKGKKRLFSAEEDKKLRRKSAYFWEERNTWFSDRWTLRGERQKLDNGNERNRSGAFPFNLAYRLIQMYSVEGDTIMDPFLGTGTTMFAAMVSCRNSIGIEVDARMRNIIRADVYALPFMGKKIVLRRLRDHEDFIKDYIEKGKRPKHFHAYYGFPVVTNQERDIRFRVISEILEERENRFRITYEDVSRETYF